MHDSVTKLVSTALLRTSRRASGSAAILAAAAVALTPAVFVGAFGATAAASTSSTTSTPPTSTTPSAPATTAPAGSSSGDTSGTASASAYVALSNLKTLSRWAYPQAEAAARAKPSSHSRVVGRLRFLTEDGQAELYMALRSYRTHGQTWIEVTLPGRPNGVTGWVKAGALGELHVVHDYLRVDRARLRATLFRGGRPIWSAPVGVGRPSLPTPAGHFYVREKLRAIEGPVYGPFALGTSAYAPTLTEWPGGGVVGIHGTNEPQLVPGRPSHGCIRMHNTDITRLWHLIGVGTPIEIR